MSTTHVPARWVRARVSPRANAARSRASMGVNRRVRTEATTEDDEATTTDFRRPVETRDDLLESEAFETALKAGFAALALTCVGIVVKLSGPVIGEMVDKFPGRH